MAGRTLVYDTEYQTVSAAQDLLELLLASGQTAKLLTARIMQKSDEASTEAELLDVAVKRASGAFTSGSGGSTATVVKYGSSTMQASGLTSAERNNTTQASGGTIETLWPGSFNVLAGEWEFTPTPELQFTVAENEAVILSLEAPADALTLRAIIVLEIIAG